MITHQNIMYNEALIQQAFGHTPDCSALGWLPLFHDMGLIGKLLQPLYVGFPGTLMPPLAFLQKPIRWLQAISRYRATTSGAPNFAYDLCLRRIKPEQKESLDLSSWNVAFCGSEPNRAETLEQFASAFATCGFRPHSFYPCYGLAEATLIVAGGRPVISSYDERALGAKRAVEADSENEPARRIVSCGKPLAGQRLIIVDPDTANALEEREVGEVWISSDAVARGYWNRPELTSATFGARLKADDQRTYLRTGDLGFLDHGNLFLTGRLRDLIIIRGQNFSPEELEYVAGESHPALKFNYGAAFMVEQDGEGRLIIAHEIKTAKVATTDIEVAMRQAIAEHFDIRLYKVILVRVGALPKTSSGKIQRHLCKKSYIEGSLLSVPSPADSADVS